MLEGFSFGELSQLFHFYRAWNSKRRRKIAAARKHLDKALTSTVQAEPYLLAFDALLMIAENRHQIARDRFAECLNSIEPMKNADEEYVSKFCKLWLAIYDETVGYEALKHAAEEQNAAWLGASRVVQICLPRSPLQSLEEICGHRVAVSEGDPRSSFPKLKQHASLTFDF